jgi:hypothetical protein
MPPRQNRIIKAPGAVISQPDFALLLQCTYPPGTTLSNIRIGTLKTTSHPGGSIKVDPSIRRSSIRVIPVILAMIAACASGAFAAAGSSEERSRAVDVVIVLDVSGSMEHLLDSVRARTWDVVNELGKMRPTPLLRVGFVSFGTDAGNENDGFVLVEENLTDELDKVYAKLMAATVGGRDERVGQALHTTLNQMNWSREWDALRVVFVAGNESADQGINHHNFRDIAKLYRDEGIIINALYAGNREQGITERWHHVAQHGVGNFSAIDPSLHTIQIPTPQDSALLELNAKLNTTYVPYGPSGQDGLANQVAQDGNASRLGVQSCSARIVTKGSALYTNASWDLVDAASNEDFTWNSIGDEDLPVILAPMTPEQRRAYIDDKRIERESIQKAIQEISLKREEYIQKALARESRGLGAAMRASVREQAMAKGFTCDDC